MLKGILNLFILVAALLLRLPTIAEVEFFEGRDFKKIPAYLLADPIIAGYTKTDKKVLVLDFFSYGCAGCNVLRKRVKPWLQDKKELIEFVEIPVVFKPDWRKLARLFYSLDSADNAAERHDYVFSVLHDEDVMLTEEELLTKVLHKFSDQSFLEKYNSFEVLQQVETSMALAKTLKVIYTPEFIVKVGKQYYRISMRLPEGKDQIDVVNYLIKTKL